MIYSVAVWILWIIETVLLGTVATLLGVVDSSGRASHVVARFWGKCIIYSSGIKVKVSGIENILRDRSQIFISNHQGYFDIFSLTAFFPVQLKWIAKKELLKLPFIGWSMRAARYISIDRQNKRSAIRSIQAAAKKLDSGFSVVIFPEGTRSLDGKMLEFKRGSLILLKKTDAPVVPVTISGSYNIIRKSSLKIHRGRIDIKIDEPIDTKNMSNEEREALLPKIRGIIEGNLRELEKSDADK